MSKSCSTIDPMVQLQYEDERLTAIDQVTSMNKVKDSALKGILNSEISLFAAPIDIIHLKNKLVLEISVGYDLRLVRLCGITYE